MPVGLDETGIRQAGEAGRRLREIVAASAWLGEKPQIVASTLPRATETAIALACHLDLPASAVHGEAALCELAFGLWEGMTTQEVKTQYPAMRRARKQDRWNFAAPGGESYHDMAVRVENWLERLNAPAIVVAHSGTMRVMAHLLAAWSRQRAMAEKIANCEIWCWENNKLLRL